MNAITPYELMIKANDYLIKGGELTERQRQKIADRFLAAVSSEQEAHRFYVGVKYPDNIDNEGRRMYPIFFIPPYNDGKKFKTITGMIPKTHILSANMYELEIIRLLHILAPESDEVRNMVSQTLTRLKTTCFGNRDDGLGECYDSSLIVLRFLAGVLPDDTKWIRDRIYVFNRHYDEKRRHSGLLRYYCLCLSELPIELAEPEILHHKEHLIKQINGNAAVNGDQDTSAQPLICCIARNCLSRLSEYKAK